MTKVMGRKLEKVQWISETMHMTCFKMNAWSCYSPVFVNMVLATNQQKYAVVTFLICCADQLKTGMTKHTLIRKPYWNVLLMKLLSIDFNLSFFWRTLKNNVQFALMFVCCKVQFEKKWQRLEIRQTVMRKTTLKLLLIIPYFCCF